MKKLRLLFLCTISLFGFGSIVGQTIRIDTTQISFENKLRPCLGVQVDPTPTLLKKSWVSYLKKNYQIKLKGGGLFSSDEVLKSENVTIGIISEKHLNLYTRITPTSSGSAMKVYACFGYDYFIGHERFPKEFTALQTLLNNFLFDFLNDYYTQVSKDASKELKQFNRQKTKILKSIDKSTKKIEKATEQMAGLTSTGESSNDPVVSGKLAKLAGSKTKLENDILSYSVKIQSLDENIVQLSARLRYLTTQQNGLIK